MYGYYPPHSKRGPRSPEALEFTRASDHLYHTMGRHVLGLADEAAVKAAHDAFIKARRAASKCPDYQD